MSGTLWGGGEPLDARVQAYTSGDDRVLDARLLRWDLYGSIGHVHGLARARLLSTRDHARLVAALRRALIEADAGTLTIGPGDEDAHTAIENHLTRALGPLGEKVHTGRSRNDQVACALRLWLKDRLLAVEAAALDVAEALVVFGAAQERTLWPGYTHQRRAMPSSPALWAAGFASALLDDLAPLDVVFALADRSPLGSAAGYGVPLPIDRSVAARALGFAGVQSAVTSVQGSRGKLETQAIAAAWGFAFDMGKLAWDVILFSSEEYGFLRLPASLATGSSIMPHKRNPDVFELTRARAAQVDGLLAQAAAIGGGLPSGYHRDLQLTKGVLFQALDTVYDMLSMMAFAIPRLEVDRERAEAALGLESFATDEVFRRVREGATFRAAYRDVARAIAAGTMPPKPARREIFLARSHEGGLGNPGLGALRSSIARARRQWRTRRRRFDTALSRLAGSRRPRSGRTRA